VCRYYRAVTVQWLNYPKVLAIIVLYVAVQPARADEIYKSVDAEGHVVYSDRATTKAAQKSTVHVIQGNAAEAARVARQTSSLEAEDAERKRQQSLASNDKAAQDHDRQVRCDNARSRYFSVKDANLVFKIDAQGNRQYYSDTEADTRREQLRQAMVAACGKGQ
jgi:hypothetical protein